MARRQQLGGRKQKAGRTSISAKFGQSNAARKQAVTQGAGGRRRPQPGQAAPARRRPTRPQLRKRALRGADASKARIAAPQNRAVTQKRPVSKRVPASTGGVSRPSNTASKSGTPLSKKSKKFQKGGEVEPLNDAHVKAFERNEAPSLAKAKSKGRAGRKTLGEASASARKRGTSKSKRLDKPLAITESRELLPGESEAQMLIRTGRRKPKK